MTRLHTVCLAIVVVLVRADASSAIDEENIKLLLGRAIIGTETTLAEVQSFTEDRVPRMPECETLKEWEEIAAKIRSDVLDNVVFQGEAKKWRDVATKPVWLDTIEGGEGYVIKKLCYEAVPGMFIPALLYEPTELKGKVPVILNVNGHDRANGKAANYKQILCINQAKRGMIALNLEWVGMGQLESPGNSHYAMNQLDLCGTSGLAPFYLAMSRGLDVLLAHENADPNRVGVAGLSGGGWQTIVISALDTRVTLANPVAGYSSYLTRTRFFKDLGDSEQTPNDLAVYADYTHLTAMLAPRAALLTFNQADNCCFEAPYALPPLLAAARPSYAHYGKSDRLHSHINIDPGTHNFDEDNRTALYRMFVEYFKDGENSYDAAEINSDKDLKAKEMLSVPIPAENISLNALAAELAKSLPRDAKLPAGDATAVAWQNQAREQLNALLRTERDQYETVAEQQNSFTLDGVRVTYWRLRVGDWTVPVVDFFPLDAKVVSIVISDDGRAACAADVHKLVAEGNRVLAVDPFYFGESKISQMDFLFAFMVATVGRRPLGIQANQIAAIARWSRSMGADPSVRLIARGPRASTIALVAAAIEPKAISQVELHDALGSLKEIVENNQLANTAPELFCFGLLEKFDILQLAALVAPRPVTFHNPADRARAELAPLMDWYKQFGVDHNPLQ